MGRSSGKTRSPKKRRAVSHGGQGAGNFPKPKRGKRFFNILSLLVILSATGLGVYSSIGLGPKSVTGTPPHTSVSTLVHPASTGSVELPVYELQPQTLDELLSIPPEKLGKVDIARMNLLCATGLPGADRLTAEGIEQALAMLDRWAYRVDSETRRNLYRFHRNPADYEHSEAYFRVLMLVTVLQQDFGVRYNLDRAREIDFTDSQDLFLHGLIPAARSNSADTNGGTCVSMPVIYTAVGRRLGYPIKLVTTKAHVFARWDDPDHSKPNFRGRFNIEATGRGLTKENDDYYRAWPKPVSDEEVRANQHLISMTPRRELALFLATRGHNLLDRGQVVEAYHTYAAARRNAPVVGLYGHFLADASRRLGQHVRPQLPHVSRAGGGYGGSIQHPDAWMVEMRRLEAIRAANQRRAERLHQTPEPSRLWADPWTSPTFLGRQPHSAYQPVGHSQVHPRPHSTQP